MKKKIVGFTCFLLVVIALVTTLVIIKNKSNVENNKVSVNISVYNKENSNILNKSIDTDKKYLIDVLNEISELKLVTQDSKYGAYITSVMGIEQDNEYYWSYYIDDNYATVGISSCEVETGKTYTLKIEKIKY